LKTNNKGFFSVNFDYDGSDFQERVRSRMNQINDSKDCEDIYCFENELGNEISIVVKEVEDESGGRKFDAVEIIMSGPTSESSNIITYYEAIKLKEHLEEFLNDSEKSKSTIKKSSKYNAPKKGHKSRWSVKYKRKINCKNPKGFSQKQYCKGKRKKSK